MRGPKQKLKFFESKAFINSLIRVQTILVVPVMRDPVSFPTTSTQQKGTETKNSKITIKNLELFIIVQMFDIEFVILFRKTDIFKYV